jgi:hypothetical protein
MTPAPHKTPLNPRPPAGTKLPVGHSKLRAPEGGALRPPLASPPSCRAKRITLSTAWLQRANPLANNSPMLRTGPKILEADGHYLPLGGQLHVSAAQPPPAVIQMKMRKASAACPARRAAARPVLGSARSPGRKISTKTTCTNHPPHGGQLHVSAAQPPPANIQMKMRKAPTACPARRAAARPVLHPARSLGRKISTKTTRANHPLLGGQLQVSAAQPPPANIPMKMRKASATCPARRTAARPVLHSARSLGRKVSTKTTCVNHPPLGGQCTSRRLCRRPPTFQ